MSRAFVKEDAQTPEPEKLEFQAFVGHDRSDLDVLPIHQGDDLCEMLRWAHARGHGYVQVRDAAGVLLAVVD